MHKTLNNLSTHSNCRTLYDMSEQARPTVSSEGQKLSSARRQKQHAVLCLLDMSRALFPMHALLVSMYRQERQQ